MAFEWTYWFEDKHLIVQPSDARLDPPQSYLFIQDFLIVSCGILYALCYFFYMTRTYRDRHISGTVLYLSGTMAYELFYAVTMTSTTFELVAFLAWFTCDIMFATVAIISAYKKQERVKTTRRLVAGVVVWLGFFWGVCKVWPDEREQVTGFWTGLLLQLPIGWGHLILLIREQHTKGQSLEIWITRYLGCITAYGVFIWRWLNIPVNWEYVNSPWSWGIMIVTLVPETVYPFVYFWAHRIESEKAKVE